MYYVLHTYYVPYLSVAYLASVFLVDIWKLSELLLEGVEPALVLVLSVHVFDEVVSTRS